MADVLHRTTKEFKRSVHTPDFPSGTWVIDPKDDVGVQVAAPTSAVFGFATKYWTITVDVVTLMTPAERTSVDDAEAATLVTAHRAQAVAKDAELSGLGVELRALIGTTNTRHNFNTNRHIETRARLAQLEARVQAMLDSTGAVANLRTDGLAVAVDASLSATATRTRPDARQDFKDDINAGDADV